MKKATTSAASPNPAPVKKTNARRATPPSAKAPKKAVNSASVSTSVSTTAVVARLDVGFGNQLFIRGEGPGLSWDQGVLMDCMSPDMWTWTSSAVSRPFAYKVLVNDEQWAAGDDFVAAVGVENAISPAF
ncbi:MAG: hypothetical protein ACREIA_26070 [Opitutaceae bacterium]